MYFRNTKVYFQSTKVYSRSTKVYSPSTKVYFQSTSILSNYTSILSKNKRLLWKYKSILWRKNPKTRLLRVLFDSIDLLALFGVYAGIIVAQSKLIAFYWKTWTFHGLGQISLLEVLCKWWSSSDAPQQLTQLQPANWWAAKQKKRLMRLSKVSCIWRLNIGRLAGAGRKRSWFHLYS